jgi:tryptophan halogenase
MKIVVVGGGTAGIMAATYFKSYWGDRSDITLVYDHQRPGIGVGESMTPMFDNYLKTVGVSTIDLIKNCNATIKLGLKFTNWTHEGSVGFHGFPDNTLLEMVDPVLQHYDAITAHEVINNTNSNGYFYNLFFANRDLLPSEDNLSYRHALHVDANLVGRYIENKFRPLLNIVDGIVETVAVENREIKSIKLKSGEEITADLFIDASGLEKVLFKHLDVKWNDYSDVLPTDRTIPNPLFKDFDTLPTYTTAEATKNGWILDVPLSNRHGTGYVYSSKFTSDDEAKEDFNQWLLKTYGVELASDRVIEFSSGYYNEQWVGNCVAIGLASGFVEPLEATNIHHTFTQIDSVTRMFSGQNLNYIRDAYNKRLDDIYQDSFKYIRFFYHTGRQDSEFWKYLSSNVPKDIQELANFMEHDFLSDEYFPSRHGMFDAADFNCIAYAHGMYKNNKSITNYLNTRYLTEHTNYCAGELSKYRTRDGVDHKEWIERLIGK